MDPNPLVTCLTRLQHLGWHIAPLASAWHAVTDIHADRWWTPQLVDTAALSLTTGQGVGQRLHVSVDTAGVPVHGVSAETGVLPLDELATLLASWPPPTTDTEAGPQPANS